MQSERVRSTFDASLSGTQLNPVQLLLIFQQGHQAVAISLRIEATWLHPAGWHALFAAGDISMCRQPPQMLMCRLEAEMAAMDVQRLQQQLQALQSRLTEGSQQRRQLQAELEQVRAC